MDRDGWEDLVMGSGAGGRLALWLNRSGERFELSSGAPFSQPVTRDQTTVLGWRNQQSGVLLLAGSASYEDGLIAGSPVRAFDVTGDGHPELVLACEWGPLRIFRNQGGRFTEWNPPVELAGQPGLNAKSATLSQLKGWWNGVAAGDFNGDGRLDIAASNWGRNTRYESFRQKPVRLYYGDLDRNGTLDLIEAHFDAGRGAYVPQRQLGNLAKGLPSLQDHYATHADFALAGIDSVLSRLPGRARFLEAGWLESTLFFNQGDSFKAAPLPVEAQFAPAFGLCVADFDGDGAEDLFLSQNFFTVQPETARYDAGRGLVLLGDGRGNFRALSGASSGAMLYGEQRGAAVCDFNHDGRVDLAVAQNSAASALFKNVSAQPGLRVRLLGLPGNPEGVGAVLRLQSESGAGPAREIHCGSGYWSRDSAVQIMSLPKKPATGLWVRWPGGRETTVRLPDRAREVEVDTKGSMRLLR